MRYRNGELSVRLTFTRGRYKCIFETKKYIWVGYTNDSEVFDFYGDDLGYLYLTGVTKTFKQSKDIVTRANRMAYRAAKEGTCKAII